MRKSAPLFCALLLSLSARRAWIEICSIAHCLQTFNWSLSARRAWIEISEGNPLACRPWSLSARRAWIEICMSVLKVRCKPWSLSARRAWIEIQLEFVQPVRKVVALRKESVDRNDALPEIDTLKLGSLSARRAWIEIPIAAFLLMWWQSLSARRAWIEMGLLEIKTV